MGNIPIIIIHERMHFIGVVKKKHKLLVYAEYNFMSRHFVTLVITFDSFFTFRFSCMGHAGKQEDVSSLLKKSDIK